MRYLIIVALLAGTAAAQPPGEVTPREDETISVWKAYGVTWLSIAAPVAVGALMALPDEESRAADVGGMIATAAIVLGPTAGHWYAGRRLTVGLGLRVAAAGTVGAMVLKDHHDRLEIDEMVVGGIVAGSLFTTGIVWDLVTLPRAVREHNRRLVVAPTPNGVAIAGAF